MLSGEGKEKTALKCVRKRGERATFNLMPSSGPDQCVHLLGKVQILVGKS